MIKARLFSYGELIGTAELYGKDAGLTAVIRFNQEYYVYNAKIQGFERAQCRRVGRIEYAPKGDTETQPQLPFDSYEV